MSNRTFLISVFAVTFLIAISAIFISHRKTNQIVQSPNPQPKVVEATDQASDADKPFWAGLFENGDDSSDDESNEPELIQTDESIDQQENLQPTVNTPTPQVVKNDEPTTLSILRDMLIEEAAILESDYDISDETYIVSASVFDIARVEAISGIEILGYDSRESGNSDAEGNIEFEARLINDAFVRVAYRAPSKYEYYDQRSKRGVMDIPVTLTDEKLIANDILKFYSENDLEIKVVSGPNQEPVSGIDVKVSIDRDMQANSLKSLPDLHYKITKPSGIVEVPYFPQAGYKIEVGTGSSIVATNLTFLKLPTEPQLIKVSNLAAINGVVYSPNGDGVEGVTVIAIPADKVENPQKYQDITNADGEFFFLGLSTKRYEIYTEVPDGAPFVSPEVSSFATAAPGDKAPWVYITLEEGEFVDGIVLDEEGNPIPEVLVATEMVEWKPPLEFAGVSSTEQAYHTDENGYFKVTGIKNASSLGDLFFIHPAYEVERRASLNMFEGVQTIVLTKINRATLKVVWEDDGTPVTYFGYRMLTQGWNGFSAQTGTESTEVYSEDGTADLSEIPNGKYTVEVTVLDPDGNLTTLRDSVAFELAQGGEELVVEVKMFGGHLIEGQVVFADDGLGVPDTIVYLVPPASGAINYRRATNSAFERLETTTSENGRFSFDGIAPGLYTLEVINEELTQNVPLDFNVEREAPPEDLKMTLHRGGIVQGYVRDEAGEPVQGAIVYTQTHSTNLDRWVQQDDSGTDENGFYQLRGLRRGMHYIRMNSSNGSRTKEIDLELSEIYDLDFDLSENVTVKGTIELRNNPNYNFSRARLVSPDGDSSSWAEVNGKSFQVSVKPGRYKLALQNFQGESDIFEVKASPDVQEFDLVIESVSADVVLVFPDGAEFVPGKLVLAPKDMSNRYRYIRREMSQEQRHITELLAGKYRATFVSNDKVWSGDTEWVELDGAGENLFLIEVEQTPRSLKIASWVSDEIGVLNQVKTIDISTHIKADSELVVLFEYESGRNAMAIERVELYGNNELISQDVHEGWAGYDVIGTRYFLRIPDYNSEIRYHLQMTMRSDGGADSNGSIYLSIK